MRIKAFLILFPSLLLADSSSSFTFRSNVEMVTLAFRVVLDNRYVTDLKPGDIQILENGREQRIETFSHPLSNTVAGASQPESIFLLIDSSNAMYSGFAYARDAMADFIRSLAPENPVAVYTFSRNIARASPLTLDRQILLASLNPSSGDDTALYNAMLLTLRDAAKVTGPKKLVVFSNGADDASMVSPDDVSRVAEDLGIPIYVVSTNRMDEISQEVWKRMTLRTGGRVHVAEEWTQQRNAFRLITEDIRNTYTVTYYSNNQTPGFRRVEVRVGNTRSVISCRPGYYAPERPERLTASSAGTSRNRE